MRFLICLNKFILTLDTSFLPGDQSASSQIVKPWDVTHNCVLFWSLRKQSHS